MKVIASYTLVAIWIVGLYFFFESKSKFSLTPGEKSQFAHDFPAQSSVRFASDLFNLVLFVHPQCSCSIATVENLEKMLAQDKVVHKRVKVHVVIFDPMQSDNSDWLKSSVVDELKRLGKKYAFDFVYDKSLGEFKAFDAKTSGQTFLFSADKKLLFNGGLTDERAHAGPAVGPEAIAEIVTQNSERLPASLKTTAVFGCDTE